jgi:hypothetical protein
MEMIRIGSARGSLQQKKTNDEPSSQIFAASADARPNTVYPATTTGRKMKMNPNE